MLARIHLFAAAALCAGSFAVAASPSIGTVTARGFTTIDNFAVKGSGTVFDGSVVETGQGALSGADLRLPNNTVLSLFIDSRGTLHRDHFQLERGSVQLISTKSFSVEADDLVVMLAGDSTGVVTVENSKSVLVVAEKGTLEVRNAAGNPIAEVHPGNPLSFTKSSTEITASSPVPTRSNLPETATSDDKMVPPVSLILPGPSAQTSSQLGEWSIVRPMGSTSLYPGADGGHCTKQQLAPCCQNTQGSSPFNGEKCCPGFFPPTKQCKGSQ